MKTDRSRWILAFEIFAIIIFHVVKFRQPEKMPRETARTRNFRQAPLLKPAALPSGADYMLVNLIK